MTGRPLSIIDSNVDADRNGILFDPLPAGTYTGDGDPTRSPWTTRVVATARTDRTTLQLDARVGYRLRIGRRQDARSVRGGVQPDRPVELHEPIGRQTSGHFLVPNGLVAGGFPRQMQIRHTAGLLNGTRRVLRTRQRLEVRIFMRLRYVMLVLALVLLATFMPAQKPSVHEKLYVSLET